MAVSRPDPWDAVIALVALAVSALTLAAVL